MWRHWRTAVFFNNFLQHVQFITGQCVDGLLSDIIEDTRENGFLAFLRLIGTLYYMSMKIGDIVASLANEKHLENFIQFRTRKTC